MGATKAAAKTTARARAEARTKTATKAKAKAKATAKAKAAENLTTTTSATCAERRVISHEIVVHKMVNEVEVENERTSMPSLEKNTCLRMKMGSRT